MQIIVTQKPNNFYLVHSVQKDSIDLNKYKLKNNVFVFTFKDAKLSLYYNFAVIEKFLGISKDPVCNFISIDGISASVHIKNKTRNMNKIDRKNYRYRIIRITNKKEELTEEEILQYCDKNTEKEKIKCYYKRLSSGDYSIYDNKNNVLAVVDSFYEIDEFFADNTEYTL